MHVHPQELRTWLQAWASCRRDKRLVCKTLSSTISGQDWSYCHWIEGIFQSSEAKWRDSLSQVFGNLSISILDFGMQQGFGVLNTALHLVSGLGPLDHVTESIKTLHWLPAQYCINATSPAYIKVLVRWTRETYGWSHLQSMVGEGEPQRSDVYLLGVWTLILFHCSSKWHMLPVTEHLQNDAEESLFQAYMSTVTNLELVFQFVSFY